MPDNVSGDGLITVVLFLVRLRKEGLWWAIKFFSSCTLVIRRSVKLWRSGVAGAHGSVSCLKGDGSPFMVAKYRFISFFSFIIFASSMLVVGENWGVVYRLVKPRV